MRSYKAKFSKEEQCIFGGQDKKKTEHVLIDCGDIHSDVRFGTSQHEA